MMTVVASKDVERLWIEFKKDLSNRALRNRLAELYLPLVTLHGKRIRARVPDSVELDDLVSAGTFGLMDAIDAFDPSRGVRFPTYCAFRIRGAMLDELRAMDWVPRTVRTRAGKLGKALAALEARLGRRPDEVELAERLDVSAAEFKRMVRAANVVDQFSLNKKWYETEEDGREIDISHILEDKKGEDPTERVQKNDLMRLVTKGLDRNERLIVILYYYERLTMSEVGAAVGLCESRISQIHAAVIRRLRNQLDGRRGEFD